MAIKKNKVKTEEKKVKAEEVATPVEKKKPIEKPENDPNYSDPNVTYYHRVRAFFEGDPDFEISELVSEGDVYTFNVNVKDSVKWFLLGNVLEVPENCSRLAMNIEYVGQKIGMKMEHMEYLLSSNPYYSRSVEGKLMKYLLMKPEVVQYSNDVFNNPYKVETKTAEDLARILLCKGKCNITSDIPDPETGAPATVPLVEE